MISTNINNQYIDWSHGPIPGPGEGLDHLGTLSSSLIIPSVTIGLSDYLNISYSQLIGVRTMGWNGAFETFHHRDENTTTDFDDQALGGIFGDGNIILKYLYENAGLGTGSRIFFGGGFSFPSNSVLKSSPFIDIDDEEGVDEAHRHFSLSDGTYKAQFEFQYFIKRKTNPMFYGVTINTAYPIGESEFGFKPGNSYTLVFSSIFGGNSKLKFLPIGYSLGLALLRSEVAYWEDVESPNSESVVIAPSIGCMWSTSFGGISLNIRKPYLFSGAIGVLENELDNKADMIEISLGYRTTLKYVIPWLYF